MRDNNLLDGEFLRLEYTNHRIRTVWNRIDLIDLDDTFGAHLDPEQTYVTVRDRSFINMARASCYTHRRTSQCPGTFLEDEGVVSESERGAGKVEDLTEDDGIDGPGAYEG